MNWDFVNFLIKEKEYNGALDLLKSPVILIKEQIG